MTCVDAGLKWVFTIKHNGRLFDSKTAFMQKASRINKYLKDWNATGFRAELTHRQPEWMQSLEIEYDLSFLITIPLSPSPVGPWHLAFFIGHFVELPYTLVQDYTLISVLGETTPRYGWTKWISLKNIAAWRWSIHIPIT